MATCGEMIAYCQQFHPDDQLFIMPHPKRRQPDWTKKEEENGTDSVPDLREGG
jgi:hypothetical protein